MPYHNLEKSIAATLLCTTLVACGGGGGGDNQQQAEPTPTPPSTVQDNTAPIITLLGDASINLALGETYTDAGAMASDDTDGDITSNIVTVNSVDNNTAGTYTITYNVADAAGNNATEVTRTVNVIEVAQAGWGNYEYLSSHIRNAQAATVKITNSSATMINEKFAITAAHSPMDENYEVTPNLTVTNIFGEVRDIINVYYTTEEKDFAVVELASPFENSYSVKIASENATTGDDIFGVGHPAQALDWAVTFGKAVNNYRTEEMHIEHDLYATGGFSGGGIYNTNGELISVISGGGAGGSISGEFIPPFTESFEVNNNVYYPTDKMEVRTVGPDLNLIIDFLNEHNIPASILNAGGSSLPSDPVDPVSIADTGYVSADIITAVANIAQQSRYSTVAITHDNTATYDNFFVNGTGVVISDDLILTVGHIVDEDYINHVSIMFPDGTVYNDNIEVAFQMEDTQFGSIDLALIRINGALPASTVIAELADNELAPNDHAYFVGNPNMLWSTEGGWHVVAAQNRGIVFGDTDGVEYDFKAQSLGGFSGSGIFNLDGKLISILHGGGCGGSRSAEIFNIQDPHSTAYPPIEGECSTKGTRLDLIKRFIDESGLMK